MPYHGIVPGLRPRCGDRPTPLEHRAVHITRERCTSLSTCAYTYSLAISFRTLWCDTVMPVHTVQAAHGLAGARRRSASTATRRPVLSESTSEAGITTARHMLAVATARQAIAQHSTSHKLIGTTQSHIYIYTTAQHSAICADAICCGWHGAWGRCLCGAVSCMLAPSGSVRPPCLALYSSQAGSSVWQLRQHLRQGALPAHVCHINHTPKHRDVQGGLLGRRAGTFSGCLRRCPAPRASLGWPGSCIAESAAGEAASERSLAGLNTAGLQTSPSALGEHCHPVRTHRRCRTRAHGTASSPLVPTI